MKVIRKILAFPLLLVWFVLYPLTCFLAITVNFIAGDDIVKED